MNFVIRAYTLQDIGFRDNQEDCFYPPFITPCHYDATERDWVYYDGTPHTDERFFILCDGMGGHDRGEVASQIVTYSMSQYLAKSEIAEGDFDDAVIQNAADEAMKALEAEYNPKETRQLGTTMTVLKLHSNGATVGHVGDSRVYQFRPAQNGEPAKILFCTQDHTVLNDSIRNGEMARVKDMDSIEARYLTRAMMAGKSAKVEVEIDHVTDIKEGDIFMLCSDGIVENMSDEELCSLITNPNYGDVERVQRLLRACNDNHDNHTATIIRIKAILNDNSHGQSSDTLSPDTVLKSSNYSYHVERLLGKGAFGNTYLVSTQISMKGQLGTIHTDVKVAMKEFCMMDYMRRVGSRLEVISNEDEVKRYADLSKAEAARLAMLSHPNIVKVLDVFEANNTFYYTMEYIPGGNLNDYVFQHFGLPERDAIACIRQIGSALSYVHQNNMLHLDVKTDNVMRTADNTLKLIDFGLSRRFTNAGMHKILGKVGTGTPGFAPLEQINKGENNEITESADVYALGATYYKILTNFSPNDAKDVGENGLNVQPLMAKNVSRKSINAIEAAMHPEASKRLQTVEDFLNMLPSVDETQNIEKQEEKKLSWLKPLLIVMAIVVSFIGISFLIRKSKTEPIANSHVADTTSVVAQTVKPADQSITMILYYTGEGDNARLFMEEMESGGTADKVRQEEGNLRYDYYFSASDPHTVILIDTWKSQSALDAHHATPMMQIITNLRNKYNLQMRAERYVK